METKRLLAGRLCLAIGATLLFFTSCKKNNDSDNEITQDDAADVMVQAVAGDSGGFALQTETSARVAGRTPLTCGQTRDTTFSGQSLPGALITWSYDIQMSRSLTCDNGVPQQFTFNYTGHNTYDAPRMSSSDNNTVNLIITGLQPAATGWVINQQYVRNGTQQSRIRQRRSFSSTLTITGSNIVVNKTTEKIVSGTATLQFVGQSSTGRSVQYGATLTFHGNNTGTLVFNNGHTVQLQW